MTFRELSFAVCVANWLVTVLPPPISIHSSVSMLLISNDEMDASLWYPESSHVNNFGMGVFEEISSGELSVKEISSHFQNVIEAVKATTPRHAASSNGHLRVLGRLYVVALRRIIGNNRPVHRSNIC
jgi:hypothetical protein